MRGGQRTLEEIHLEEFHDACDQDITVEQMEQLLTNQSRERMRIEAQQHQGMCPPRAYEWLVSIVAGAILLVMGAGVFFVITVGCLWGLGRKVVPWMRG